ncbi:MAG: hypothetical protein AB7I19_15285 [Planctomycetota bacterium]
MATPSLRATSLFAVASLAAGLAAQGPAADVYVPGSTPVAAPVQGPSTPGIRVQAANVIYDNGPIVTAPGGSVSGRDLSVLQNITLGDTTLGFSANNAGLGGFNIADDFIVPPGQMWYVESVEVYGYRTNANPVIAFTDGVVQVLDSDPLAGPANVVFGDLVTNRLAASGDTNASRVAEGTNTDGRQVAAVTLTVGKLFKPGQYWLVYGLNTNAAASSTFVPPVTITGSTNTGDGRQFAVTAGTWAATVHGGSGNPCGIPFKLCGEVACCWEPNYGPSLGHGDDSVTQNLALNFNFPLPGQLPGGGTTNTVAVTSNGYVSLNNAPGSDFSPTVSEFTNNQPRIAMPWDDYNAATGGSVHWIATPLRGIATWVRIDTFSGATTESILQLQMFPNGTFTINCWRHEPVTLRTPVFGVSAGAGAASVAIDATAGHIGTPGVATIYESFTSGTSDLSGNFFCFEPRNDGVGATYDISVSPACCQLASNSLVAPGCFGFATSVVNNAIAGGTAHLASILPPGTVGQVTLLGGIPTPFALDLSIIGAPTCFLHHSNDLFAIPMDGAGNSFLPLPCLSFLLGFPIQAQGVAIAPGVNAGGIATGDSFSLVIGNL